MEHLLVWLPSRLLVSGVGSGGGRRRSNLLRNSSGLGFDIGISRTNCSEPPGPAAAIAQQHSAIESRAMSRDGAILLHSWST